MTKYRKQILSLFFLISAVVLLSPVLILAQDAKTPPTDECPSPQVHLNVPLGGKVCMESFGAYVQLWYNFAVGAVGIMAVIMIMWGGFRWLTSRGDSSVISDAKDRIFGAIIGLVLVFLSYTLLNLINPNLTKIELPTLEKIKVTTQTPGTKTALYSDSYDPNSQPVNGSKYLIATEDQDQARQYCGNYCKHNFTTTQYKLDPAPAGGWWCSCGQPDIKDESTYYIKDKQINAPNENEADNACTLICKPYSGNNLITVEITKISTGKYNCNCYKYKE